MEGTAPAPVKFGPLRCANIHSFASNRSSVVLNLLPSRCSRLDPGRNMSTIGSRPAKLCPSSRTPTLEVSEKTTRGHIPIRALSASCSAPDIKHRVCSAILASSPTASSSTAGQPRHYTPLPHHNVPRPLPPRTLMWPSRMASKPARSPPRRTPR